MERNSMAEHLLQVRCTSCDDSVQLPPDDIWLDSDLRHFRFTCPECGHGISRTTTMKAVGLLREAGVLDVNEIVEQAMKELEE